MNELADPTSKADLLERIRRERTFFETALQQVSRQDMLKPGVNGDWTVKDLLAHITSWEQRMAGWVEQALRGEAPEAFLRGIRQEDIDRWNAEAYQKGRDRHLDEVIAESRISYQDALRAAESASENDLMDGERFAWRNGSPLWRMVAANTIWHYHEHGEQIIAWLRTARVD